MKRLQPKAVLFTLGLLLVSSLPGCGGGTIGTGIDPKPIGTPLFVDESGVGAEWRRLLKSQQESAEEDEPQENEKAPRPNDSRRKR